MSKMNNNDRKKMVEKLKRSKAYRIAYNDKDFLDSGVCRPSRLQLELLKPETIFTDEKILSTIVVFGGARLEEPKVALANVKKLQKQVERKPGDQDLRKKLRIAKSILDKSKYYDEAREFARLVSSESQIPDRHEYVITTGGGPGIMEAANRGAYDIAAKSVGLNITLPMEQDPNAYISPELCMQFHYFAIRKMHFLLRAKALLAFPGGYGTMDELFEGLTLVQTKKVKPVPIILFGESYWKNLINFDFLVKEGTIGQEDLGLFVFADKAKDAWDYIKYFYATEGNNNISLK